MQRGFLLNPSRFGVASGTPINVTVGNNTGNTYSGLELTAIFSGDPTTPLGGDTFARVNQNTRSGLMRMPGLSNITGPVTLTTSGGTGTRLRLYKTLTDGQTETILLQLLKVTHSTVQATWNERSTGVAWATAGALGAADYDATTLASALMPDATGYVDFYGAGLTTVIQNIINGVAGYAGLKLQISEAFQQCYLASEGGTDGQRPVMHVVGVTA